MLNRKESLKKSLGISEYPWSSDDEEPDNAQPMSRCRSDLVMMHRRTEQSRPSIGDMPGTSNQQSPTTTTTPPQDARRAQEKMDRDLFWSMLRSPHRSNLFRSAGSSSRGEVSGIKHSPAAEMRVANDICDVQRMIFHRTKRIPEACRNSRSALNLSSSGHQSSSMSREYPSPTFMATQRLAAAMMRARSSRRQRPEGSEPTPTNNDEPQSSGSSRQRPTVSNDEPIEAVEQINIEHSDDEPDLRRATSPQSPSLLASNNEPRLETAEAPTHNTSAMSLEEEVVEIEAEAARSCAPPAAAGDAQNAGNEQSINSENRPATESHQPHGVKRKRETVEDSEPNSVKEFNQSLLRLLECPVCLEWMEPPMSQCRRGHLVCGRCRSRLQLCPVCRTAFSSVRNRAMEGVAEMLRYPCRHGCGREVRLRRRTPHEASCAARRYRCVACRPPAGAAPHAAPARDLSLPLHELAAHFQSKHLSLIKSGKKHRFSVKVNVEQHDTWLVMALRELFHLQIDVDLRVGLVAHVAYIGPMCKANNYLYEVTVSGQHNSRKLVYTRATHCDLESTSINIGRQDCFHLSVDQALNFLRVKNRHCETDKFLNFTVEITQCEENVREDSDF